MVADVPEARRLDAEEVRRHLVCLRGGGLFLSPDEADLLASWLESGISVAAIVHALERAADARRKRPTRLPLTLKAAKRHLGKSSKGALPKSPTEAENRSHPLEPLTNALRLHGADSASTDRIATLAESLEALPTADPDRLERDAQGLFRDFLLQSWEELPEWEREARLTSAREELGDLVDVMPPAAVEASAREIARAQLRQRYPLLTAATLRQVLHP